MAGYESHTRTGSGTLVDQVRENPVDVYLLRRRRITLWVILALALALALWCLWRRDRGPEARDGGGDRPSSYGAAVPLPPGAPARPERPA